MEVSLTSNHYTLSLTSRSPSSSSLSSLRSIRAQFLSSSHNIRPPGCVRSRNDKCKRFHPLRLHSPRFIFKASLSSHSVVAVITLVTLSAVYLFYYNYIKRKKNSKEILGHTKFALSQQGGNIGNQAIQSQIVCFQEFQGENLLKEMGILEGESDIENLDFEGKEAQLTYCASPMAQEEETVVNEKLESRSDVLTSSVNTASSSNTSKVVDESHLSMEFQSSSFEPLSFAADMTELQVEETRDEARSDSEFPITINKHEHTASFDPLNNEITIVKDHAEEKIELGRISSDVLAGESARKELYMFYQVTTSSKGSMSPLNGLKPPPSHAFFMKKKELQSPIVSSALKGPESLKEASIEISENVEGVEPRASYKKAYSQQNGSHSLSMHNGSLSNRGKKDLDQKSNELLPRNSVSSREHVDKENCHAQHLITYNSLLKAGRLHECVKLLEDMEMKGILDMTKVYHAKFFNICKRQKAVREAFDYIKLIPNPKLSTFNMLMSVCSSSQNSEGAFQVLDLVQGAGFKPDCKLYTTLISTCAKSGKVDQMFEVFNNMVNSGIEPNAHTYGALIDGCARAGQIAKAFGAYGILRSRSKKLKPDRVVFNALIAACARSGTVERAFDVLEEMAAESTPIEPDHVTIGTLMKACANAGQVERAREVYKLLDKYGIKGTPEVYTIAINACSQTGDWEFACDVYSDMIGKGVFPDEMFLSALIDFAGHAGKLDAAFELLQEARNRGIPVGKVSYSSLMGACSNTGNWDKALELYEDIKSRKLVPSVSTVNALITSLCDGDQFRKAMEVLFEMKGLGLRPNSITYSLLVVASEKKDDLEAAQMLLSQAKKDGVPPNPVMFRCIIGMCLRRYEKAWNVGELSFDSRKPHVNNKWTSLALVVYRDMIRDGTVPTSEILSQIFGCLQLPNDASLKDNLIESLGVSAETSKRSNLCSLIDGFGEYDPRAFSLLEEAASLGIVPFVSFKMNPIVVDLKELHNFTAEVYVLTVMKGLKHRLSAGTRLPNLIILLSVEKTNVATSKGEKHINVSGRAGQAVTALLRRLRIPYHGSESFGKIRINGATLRRWLQPKLASPFSGKPGDFNLSRSLGKGISLQQRNIRTSNLSLD